MGAVLPHFHFLLAVLHDLTNADSDSQWTFIRKCHMTQRGEVKELNESLLPAMEDWQSQQALRHKMQWGQFYLICLFTLIPPCHVAFCPEQFPEPQHHL